MRLFTVLAATLLLAALGLSMPAFAQDGASPTLRERIKARMEERKARRGEPAAAPEPAASGGQLGAGTHTLYLEHGGLRRKYLLHIPAGLDAKQPAPLVVALHGGGGHAEYMADDANYGLITKADLEGFVAVFPNGYSKLPSGRFATWNAGGCCGDARDRNIDDVGFIRAVVAAVQAQVPIDAARIYATGMSNGGMMSHRLACDAADLFSAVASVAGTDASHSCTPSRPISVLHIHAKDDPLVLFGGGAGQGGFRDSGKVMDFISVHETISRWVQREQCSATPQTVLDRTGARCEAYSGCAGGAALQLCVTDDGGHSWPGAQSTRRGKPGPSQALDANAVIWDFFKANPRR